MELANSLSKSASFTNNPPPPPSVLPTTSQPPTKGKALANGVADIKIPSATQDELIIPAGTFSTTASLPPVKSLITEVLELETALAAKQAALEECGKMIDSAVDELTSMTSAGDTFWADIKRLKEGKRGRGQWAIVPKPDFGRVADGQKAKDVIIPYAIDEGESVIVSLALMSSCSCSAREMFGGFRPRSEKERTGLWSEKLSAAAAHSA